MDRLSEKKKRLTEEVVPFARKLLTDKSNHDDYVLYQTQLYCRKTFLLSAGVARDYAVIALELAKRDRLADHANP